MHTRFKLLPLLAIVLAGCTAPEKVAVAPSDKQIPPASLGVDNGSLESRLMGTWLLVKAAVPGSPSGIGVRRKIFTPGHWEMVQADPVTGQIVFRHGGTYRLNGDELEQTVDFAAESTASYVHQVHKFKITVEGDTYNQVGIGNPFTEVWRRVSNVK